MKLFHLVFDFPADLADLVDLVLRDVLGAGDVLADGQLEDLRRLDAGLDRFEALAVEMQDGLEHLVLLDHRGERVDRVEGVLVEVVLAQRPRRLQGQAVARRQRLGADQADDITMLGLKINGKG